MPSLHPPSSILHPRKILVRGVNWLGDAVMTTPALQRLREAQPDAEIVLLTHEKLADLWREHPAINSVKTFAQDESAWSVGRKLREEKFDAGLALPHSHRSAMELWLAGIPERIGYAHPFRNLFLTHAVAQREGAVKMRKRSVAEIKRLIANPNFVPPDFPPQSHHIFQYLHLVTALGGKTDPLPLKLQVGEQDIAAFRQRLLEISGHENQTWLGVNPGAEYGPARCWPAERFIAAAIEIHRHIKCGWMIFGTANSTTQFVAAELERKLGQNFVGNFVGKTTLRELCAGLKLCRFLLTNDTGPMHVAAALGTPVAVSFGSTCREMTGPIFSNGNVLIKSLVPCSPCFLRECPIDFRCMKSIEVSVVVERCLALLNKV